MSKPFEIQKHTSLEVALDNGKTVKDVLDYKVQEATEKGLPVEATVADYIALSVDNMDTAIEKLKAYKKSIDEAIKTLSDNKELTKQDVFEWMQEVGMDKLCGVSISRITAVESGVSIKRKFVLDVDNEKLEEMNLGHYEEDITTTAATIKINKKRVKNEI